MDEIERKAQAIVDRYVEAGLRRLEELRKEEDPLPLSQQLKDLDRIWRVANELLRGELG